jgi:hypothetical protein
MVKCLKSLNRDLAKTIIIENHVENYSQNITNGVYIPTFTPGREDSWLKHLSSYLIGFLGLADFRTKIVEDFRLEEVFGGCRQS